MKSLYSKKMPDHMYELEIKMDKDKDLLIFRDFYDDTYVFRLSSVTSISTAETREEQGPRGPNYTVEVSYGLNVTTSTVNFIKACTLFLSDNTPGCSDRIEFNRSVEIVNKEIKRLGSLIIQILS